jgi:hypothetical protein
MNLSRLLVGLGIAAVISLLVLWLLHKRSVSAIPPNTDATISVDGNTVTIERNNEHIVKYAPRGTKIVINKDGSVKVVSKQYGLCREFGGGMMIEGRKPMLMLDVKVAYVQRFGLHVNLGIDIVAPHLVDVFHPAVSLSYNLPIQALSNTSLFVGHSLTSDQWITGLRVRF